MYRTPKRHPMRAAMPHQAPITDHSDRRLRRYVPPEDDGRGRWEVNYDAQTNGGAFINLRTFKLDTRAPAQFILDYQSIVKVRATNENESHGGIMRSAIHVLQSDQPLFLVHTPLEVMTLINLAHGKITSKDKGMVRARRQFTADEIAAGEHTITFDN